MVLNQNYAFRIRQYKFPELQVFYSTVALLLLYSIFKRMLILQLSFDLKKNELQCKGKVGQ